MPENCQYADIILPLKLNYLLTYSIPDDIKMNINIGSRVVVQLGKRKYYTGIVRNIHNKKPENYQTKDIISVLDRKPIVNEIQLNLWEWIASYYMCTTGEVYKAAIPSGLKIESEAKIIINNNFKNTSVLNEKETLVFNTLTNKKTLTVNEVNKLFAQKNAINTVKSLLDKNAIILLETLKENYKPRTEKYIRLSKKISGKAVLNNTISELEKAPKQQKLLLFYLQLSDFFGKKQKKVSKKNLLAATKISSAVLSSIIKKGLLEEYKIETGRLDFNNIKTEKPNILNPAQQKAMNEIKERFVYYDTTLLYGVTSSGKTEIYIHLIQEYLDKGKQVLYLLPEIALTTQIISRLKKVFGNKIGIYHSKFSDAERVETWKNIIENKNYRIILGVRSSVFLPFDNLGLIIVDEEHENTYKQFDPAPRYNARDVSIILARKHGAKVLLGTATPAIETYFNAENKKFGMVELKQRYKDISLPEIIIADIKEAKRKKKMKGIFSPLLINSIDEALNKKEQIILFQNRRGFSSYIICTTCSWVPKCKHCDVSLTYHKGINRLVCHYCGYSIYIPKTCGACGNVSIQTMGFGTEQIEDEISTIFPQCNVARLDLDTAKTRNTYEKIITDFESGAIDILIGTQMVSKGLDFDNVSVVGILNADNMLNYPDFRAFERSYQLMAQVSGRAGRKFKQGKVVIQTFDVKHPIICNVVENNYSGMYNAQLKERKIFKYPPYYRLINITLKHKDRNKLNNACIILARELKKVFGKRVLGPEAPLVARIQNLYLKQFLIKYEREIHSQKVKNYLVRTLNEFKSLEKFKSVQIVLNIDPM